MWIASSAWKWAPTTICPNPSIPESWWPGSAPSSGAPRPSQKKRKPAKTARHGWRSATCNWTAGLAASYKRLSLTRLKESVFLTARTTAMVCWLLVGSWVFSSTFAALGGQRVLESWVYAMDLSPAGFLFISQFIIFLLGWPLDWTVIIIIFVPIFLPMLPNFGIDPLFFGLLTAVNLQTAFLSPPMAMAAYYLKGVAPPQVTLADIFMGMIPFMLIQLAAVLLLAFFPQIGLWLPQLFYQ